MLRPKPSANVKLRNVLPKPGRKLPKAVKPRKAQRTQRATKTKARPKAIATAKPQRRLHAGSLPRTDSSTAIWSRTRDACPCLSQVLIVLSVVLD